MITIRCLLMLTTVHGWSLVQLDINNTFLHSSLDEKVYIKLSHSFTSKGENYVCKLSKSIYGLKQASWYWFSKFSANLLDHDCSQSKNDYSLFTRTQVSSFIAFLVYIDDIVIASNDDAIASYLNFFLHSQIKLKDFGPLKYFLRLEVAYSTKDISIF